jgi:non-lysosomal glucosylceramidase
MMLNSGGTFGPWHFKPGSPEEDRRLSGAAFHFYEKPEGGEARVTTLTATRQMPGWPPLPAASGFYHALYPKGWFVYPCFTADLLMKFFTPIIRGNVKETSYPVAVFVFEVANPTDRPLDVAILFTFPNAAGHTAELRSGFINFPEAEAAEGIVGVVLDARYERNPATSQDTEWCIAVRAEHGGEISSASSWNAMASGEDIRREFAENGRLPNKALDATESAAAVAFRAQLKPKASISVPFVLSWDFPRVAFGPTEWWRRYTEYFDRSASNAFAIAREALLHHDEWETAVDAWMRPILDDPAYPDWLKQGAFNELYYESFGGAFWEAGCITKPLEFKGLHPEDHKHFTLASAAQPLCDPLGLRFAAQRERLALWPQIERDVLTAYADAIDAATPFVHDLGKTDGDPFFECNASPAASRQAKDLPALFILQVYAYYRATDDRAFVDYTWSACKKCYAALRAVGTSGYGLPNHLGDDTVTSPCSLHGVSLLGGGLCVAALEALERLADVCSDPDAAAIRRLLPLARGDLDRELWRPQLGYYGIDTQSRNTDALAAGALSGLRFAQANGLAPFLPPERVHQHLRQVFLRCVKPLRDSTGDGVGDVGAISVVNPSGRPPALGRCAEVSVADTYRLAATLYRVGRERGDKDLLASALQAAYGVYYQTWVVEPGKPFWAFSTPQAWRADSPAHARAPQHIEGRAIWDLLLEIKDPYARPPAKE